MTAPTRPEILAAARKRQAGAGFCSKLLTVTDEELAQADASIEIGLRPDLRRTVANGFRLTAYGIERL